MAKNTWQVSFAIFYQTFKVRQTIIQKLAKYRLQVSGLSDEREEKQWAANKTPPS